MNQPQARKSNLHGIVLLDKPLGLSSNAALQKVKRILKVKKAGHTGSLDPLATGLLAVCLGEATKISAYLLDSDKRYLSTFRLGETTATGDAEGDILEQKEVTEAMLARIPEVIKQFTGEIEQIPPMYSAIKHKGQPLYKLARAGQEVERQSRKVRIHEMNLIKVEGNEVTLDILCSKGTYIRPLAED
ncbi:MAG: tRNA pseudouridine(55) synthase TruB, partial [Gammaproteobacteria bacterium]|nr:tRNA pseudouridine(55) synthase TruB [Gammaproteobacteria bacterium]